MTLELAKMLIFLLWGLGAIFVLLILQSDDPHQQRKLLLLALIWPVYSLFLALYDFLFDDDD
tara:strand:+ start:1466 stop:1651 length:186 start_codon:yes stop_codon:yes gene_type:complete